MMGLMQFIKIRKTRKFLKEKTLTELRDIVIDGYKKHFVTIILLSEIKDRIFQAELEKDEAKLKDYQQMESDVWVQLMDFCGFFDDKSISDYVDKNVPKME